MSKILNKPAADAHPYRGFAQGMSHCVNSVSYPLLLLFP